MFRKSIFKITKEPKKSQCSSCKATENYKTKLYNPAKDIAGYYLDANGNRIVQCKNLPDGCVYMMDPEGELNPDGNLRYPCGKIECDKSYTGDEYESDSFEHMTPKQPIEKTYPFVLYHTVADARKYLNQHGYQLRVVIINSEYIPVDAEYSSKRLNVEISLQPTTNNIDEGHIIRISHVA